MSILEVAKRAGVSVATVSRALNCPERVSPDTRQRIVAAAEFLRYQPNASARTLRSQRSRVMGVVLPTLLNPVFAECLAGVSAAAAGAGYSINPVTTDYSAEQEVAAVERLLAASVEGMVLVVAQPDNSAALRLIQEAEVPYVLAYNRHGSHPCVGVDGEQAMEDLVTRLVSLGHRRITMVSGELMKSDRARQRYQGFLSGMRRAGLIAPALIEVPFVQAITTELESTLSGPLRPTALVCSNDLVAMRCMRTAARCGLQVPTDLSVIGFDGISIGLDLAPMLSSVTQPNQMIGQRSVELLMNSIATGTPMDGSASVTLAYEFRFAESCAPPSSTLFNEGMS